LHLIIFGSGGVRTEDGSSHGSCSARLDNLTAVHAHRHHRAERGSGAGKGKNSAGPGGENKLRAAATAATMQNQQRSNVLDSAQQNEPCKPNAQAWT